MSGVNFDKLKALIAADGLPVSPDGQVQGIDYESYHKWVLANVFNKPDWTFTDVKYQWESLHLSQFVPKVIAAQVALGPVSGVSLSGNAVGEDGYLIAGTGNPASGFTLVNGDKCQVALSVRYTQNRDIPALTDGAFVLPAADLQGNEWAFAYSISCDSFDDYDVTMSVTTDPTGGTASKIIWTLQGTAFTSEDTGGISDNAVSDDGKTIQNIERFSLDFIKSKLLPPANTQDIPSGRFTISLSAIAKDGSDSAVLSVPVLVSPVTSPAEPDPEDDA